jgi:hypothetical protein
MHLCLQQVNIGNMVASVWPNTPSVIRSMLSSIQFAQLNVSWDSSGSNFGIGGAPDLSNAPALK